MDKVLRAASGEEITLDIETMFATPAVFLAGPADDNDDWRMNAVVLYREMKPDVLVAVPGMRLSLPASASFNQHVRWRRTHQWWASACGVILFWLPRTLSGFDPSLIEVGEWLAAHSYRNVKLVVGIEPGFAGEAYLRQRIYHDFRDVPVVATLNEACAQCVEFLRSDVS